MNRANRLLFSAFCALAAASGCTCHHTDSTEVGVLTRKATLFGLLGPPGIQEEVYAPGATYVVPAFMTDWHVYDVALQNLAMTKDPRRGDRDVEDDVELKTIDGNDLKVDVTVAWQIDPKRTPSLLQNVGETTEEVKEKLVRPACRSIVRDVLNSLQSEEFYVSDKRFEKANEAKDRLAEALGPEGVIVLQVILGEHHFHPEYEKVILEKKLAEQSSERLRSEAKAAAEQAKRDLERAKGTVSQQLAKAAGDLDTVKIQADAAFFQNQQRAEAIKAEKAAKAAAVQKQNEALAGTGGRTMVKLRIAEALQGKRILFVPSGKASAGLQTLNLNQLIGSYAVTQSQQDAKAETTSP
jgi:regulator of protease activity HflC (stomatin/prohibitin superfamily)